ncbi:MAG: hypothetical protein JWL74_735 [Alphaproteobacteria bacterium]|nr:hypothetical protein [Alphaproteobacteria bacterium]
MAERVDDCPVAVAVELILDRPLDDGAGGNGAREGGVDVSDIDHETRRGAGRLLGPRMSRSGHSSDSLT